VGRADFTDEFGGGHEQTVFGIGTALLAQRTGRRHACS